MRARSRLRRAVPVALAVGLLASCSAIEGGHTTSGGLPSPTVVRSSRFVSTVSLDGGALVVRPPGTARARLPVATATAMFRATDAVDGAYEFSIVGLGEVTLSPTVSAPTTTSAVTSPTSSTTVVGTSTSSSVHAGATTTTTATHAAPGGASPAVAAGTSSTTSSSTTVATTTSTSSTAPSPAATTPPALPRYAGRLAWVGIAWDTGCPGASGATSTTLRRPGGTSRYTAVIIDAQTGRDVVVYTSGGAPPCGGAAQPAAVTRPAELISVPWRPVGPTSTAVVVSLPLCATYYGWTDVQGAGTTAVAVEVEARVPFDPTCGAPAGSSQTVDDVVPLGKAQAQVPHAPLGPVEAERTLLGG